MAEIGYILEQDVIGYLFSGTLSELTGGRKAIGGQPAVEGDFAELSKLINSTVEEVAGYCRHWYDMDKELREFIEYSVSGAFSVGQRVAGAEDGEGVRGLYLCIQDAPAGTALTDTAYFSESDDRNEKLVEITCMLIIYKASLRYNPRQIPENRRTAHDDAMLSLKDIQKGNVMLNIAQRENVESDDAGQRFAWGAFEDSPNEDY